MNKVLRTTKELGEESKQQPGLVLGDVSAARHVSRRIFFTILIENSSITARHAQEVAHAQNHILDVLETRSSRATKNALMVSQYFFNNQPYEINPFHPLSDEVSSIPRLKIENFIGDVGDERNLKLRNILASAVAASGLMAYKAQTELGITDNIATVLVLTSGLGDDPSQVNDASEAGSEITQLIKRHENNQPLGCNIAYYGIGSFVDHQKVAQSMGISSIISPTDPPGGILETLGIEFQECCIRLPD